MYGINIENGKKNKCPHPNCGSIYSIENENEILYRNITLFHEDKKTGCIRVKCKNCKNIIKINS
jgi:hypothetical protein